MNAMPTLFSFNELNKLFFKVPLVSLASKFISKYKTKLPFVVTEKKKGFNDGVSAIVSSKM